MVTHGPFDVAGYIRGASLSLHMTYIQIITNYENPDFLFENSHQCRSSVLQPTPGGNSCMESAPLS